MPDGRPAIPRPLQRRLKEEAGYRCAIPTCGQTVGLVFAHIEPWAKVQEHTFDNLIVLCSTCHTRFDIVKDIPKISILHFKRNLSLLTHRYTQVENQFLAMLAKDVAAAVSLYPVHPGMLLLYTNLIDDGLVGVRRNGSVEVTINSVEPNVFLVLTEAGAEFVRAMASADELS